MENKKVIETIEKKLAVTVEKVFGIEQNGKEVVADVQVKAGTCKKVVLKEMANQYGPYYKVVSESTITYEEKEEKKPEPKKEASGKLRTKTEVLCGVRRRNIINVAMEAIKALADGTATLKEIEGPAKEDTAIRFVLISNDGSRFKEDIEISRIRELAEA